ncbi:MAG: polysaccharide deacetylase family protein [Actinobacteria bacterium]|nr:polysaccharide deacetylase family protein [Actinomycetota bacterium]
MVTVDNSPPAVSIEGSRPAFSPNGDGRKDSIVLTATSDEPAELTIEVLDPEGEIRRTWSSPGMTTRFAVKWGGRDQRGILQDGRYRIHSAGVDRVGLRGDSSRRATIDTLPPRIRSLKIGPRLFNRLGTLTARFQLRDLTGPDKVQLQIADRFNVIRRIPYQSVSEGTIRYLTRYGGGRPLYPGLYSARLRVVDGAGNFKLSRDYLWRMHRPVKARVFNRLDDVGRRIALTFDDCNHSSAWASILRTLAAFRVKASFFCSGQQISADREVARRAVQQGHAMGAHGWDHALLVGRSRSETEWRIKADARLWWEIAKDTTAPFYRPAYGGFDSNVLAAAGATGHGRVVMWDVDSLDYASSSSGEVAGRVLNEVRPGSIVLLHVLDKTATALPAILRGLSDRRLKPVDLHSFFRAGGYR